MAGPEPYAQVKWTREQDEAYAEGRKSAQGSSQGRSSPSGAKKTGSGRKRYVRTDAGARRYHVPVGSEIGTARNAKGAQAQKDTESTGRYSELVGTDARAQAEAMNSLNDDQLQRLAQVAYSFRSSDPNVVRLRLGVAAALKRRGFNVNDFGGLGGGSARPTGLAPVRKASKAAPIKKAAPAPAPAKKVTSAMSARANDRKLREMSVPQLRGALRVFGRVAPDKRQAVARFLVTRAIELAAPNLLGRSVIEAANLPEAQRTQVIELAGRWKHGYIPLDAVAMRSKMKGGHGKPWWEGGKRKRNTSASTMAKSVQAGRVARANKAARRGSVTGVEPVTQKRYDPKDTPDFVKNSKGRDFLNKTAAANRDKPLGFTTHKADGTSTFTKTADRGVPAKRTNVVKSSPKPERGSKVTHTATGSGAGGEKTKYDRAVQAEGFRGEVTSSRTAPDQSKIAPQFRTGAAKVDSRHEGATMSDRDFAKLQMDRDAAPRGVEKARLTKKVNDELARRKGTPPAANAEVPQHIKMAGDRKLTQLIRTNSANAEHAKTELASRKAHRAKQAAKSSPGKA